MDNKCKSAPPSKLPTKPLNQYFVTILLDEVIRKYSRVVSLSVMILNLPCLETGSL